jgi:outer membrane lipoprotein-sorting protein
MNKSLVFARRGVLASLVFLCGFVSVGVAQKPADEKLTAEQLISRHLESIGSAEARSAVQSVVAVGTSKATFHGRGGGIAEGITVIASKGKMYMVAMKFNTSDYPFEKMGFDGSDFTVGFVRPGIRTNLGSFLRTNDGSFKTGVMSGALSTSWALRNVDPKEVKVKYSGIKKIDGKQLHAMDYSPKKGSDLSMTLYFDPETYQHVRTEYKRIIAARQGATVDASAGQSETRYKMVEEFSNFNEVNKLKLPHTYKLFLEILTGNGTTSYEWLMELQKFSFNQEIDDKDFKLDSY